MTADIFAERLAKIRDRFVAALPSKIDESDAALPLVAGDGPANVEAVAETYRRLHGIAGTGPTIGFAATGAAAREAEAVLIEAYRGQRALTADEARLLGDALLALRRAAQGELQTSK
jgi:chemotaxis protein histidine kinase CheA